MTAQKGRAVVARDGLINSENGGDFDDDGARRRKTELLLDFGAERAGAGDHQGSAIESKWPNPLLHGLVFGDQRSRFGEHGR